MFKWSRDFSWMLKFFKYISCLSWHDKNFSLKMCWVKQIDLIPWGEAASATLFSKGEKITSPEHSDGADNWCCSQLRDETGRRKTERAASMACGAVKGPLGPQTACSYLSPPGGQVVPSKICPTCFKATFLCKAAAMTMTQQQHPAQSCSMCMFAGSLLVSLAKNKLHQFFSSEFPILLSIA